MKRTIKWNIAQKAERTWWQRYLKGKDVAAYQTWKRAYWQGILNSIADAAPVLPGMDILDAGCGPAGIFMNLEGCQVDAVDPLLDSYAADLPHFKSDMYPYSTFHAIPMEQFTTDHRYDIVFCMNAINHVYNIGTSYDLLTNLLKPGGKLVVSIDAHNHKFFKHLFRMIPGDILHPHQYDLAEYACFLTSRSCRIVQTERIKHEFFFDHYVQVAEKQ